MSRSASSSALALGILAVALCFAGESRAAVSVVPSQAVVTPGQANTITIRYQFTGLVDAGPGPAPFSGIEESLLGTFLGPTRAALGTVTTAVIATIVGGSGATTETLTVPPAVIDAAIRLGFRQITFERTFVGAANSPTTVLSIVIASSEAVGPLRILRTELYFGNRRGEITVKRNERGLKAFADIRYAGTGVLTGFWEVDGRKILDITRQLAFGTNVTLSTPDVPDLPTFDTGAHIVRFVVTNPASAVPLPQLLYYVAAAKELQRLRISAQAEEGAAGASAKRVFSWEKPPGIYVFFLEFSEEPGGKPVFSAFTREGRYSPPDKGIETIFSRGKRYYWRVKGYDNGGEQVAESTPASFVY